MITFYLITSFLTHIFIYAYYAIFNVQIREGRVEETETLSFRFCNSFSLAAAESVSSHLPFSA